MGLQYDIFTTKRASINRGLPGGYENLQWVPTSHTLIYGEKDAILVDSPLTVEGSLDLIDWLVSKGKNLIAIYTTHPHGDHFFGNGMILQRFPKAKPLAIKEVVDVMATEVSPERRSALWEKLFPGQIPSDLPIAEVLEHDELQLEGETLKVIRTGHTDTDHSTTLFVPSIGLAITGDATYNNVHPMLMESGTRESRAQWLAALDIIAALRPNFVVSGHKDPTKDDDPRVIEETRQYLLHFEKCHEETNTVEELFRAVLSLHPSRLNPGSVWGSAGIAKNKISLHSLLGANPS